MAAKTKPIEANGELEHLVPHLLNPLALAKSMIDKGMTEQLGKMMDLAERWQSLEAKKAFAAAMNPCQAEMGTVIRDKDNFETRKKYAPVETVQSTAKPVYIRHGFSLTFGTEPGREVGLTDIYLDVRHVGGHVERHFLRDVCLDTKGPKGGATKTDIQGLMSSLSYAQGRLIRMVFNLTVADEDRDGARLDGMPISQEQAEQVNALIVEKGVDLGRFLKWAGVEKVEEMTAGGYAQAMDFLRRRNRTEAAT